MPLEAGGRRASIVTSATDVVFVATIVLTASNAALALGERTTFAPPIFGLGLLLVLLCLVEQRGAVFQLDWRQWLLIASLAAYGGARLLSGIGALDAPEAMRRSTGWGKDVLVAVAVLLAARVKGRLRFVAPSLLGAWAILVVPSLVQAVTHTYEHDWWGLATVPDGFIDREAVVRIGGPLGDPNVLAQWVLMVTAVTVAVLASAGGRRPRWQRWLAVGVLIIGTATVVATKSRGGLIGLVVLLVGLLIVAVPRGRRLTLAGCSAALVVGVLFLSGDLRHQVGRIEEVAAAWNGDVAGDSSAAGYAGTFRAGLRMFVDDPLNGVGAGNFVLHYQAYAPFDGIDTSGRARAAHNVVIELVAETGIVGAIAFGVMASAVVLVIRRGRHGADRPLVDGIALALVVFVTTSMVKNLSNPQLVLILVAIAGATSATSATPAVAAEI